MFQTTLFTIHETPVTFMSLITFLFLLVFAWIIAKGVKSAVMKIGMLKQHVSPTTLYGFGRLGYYLVLVTGLYIALLTIGINLTGIAVIAGALSIGIGFGLQSIFNNFAAGIILLIEKKIRIGDLIQIENEEFGAVKEINLRSTLVQTLDHRQIIIPNTEIVSKKLTNWTLDPTKLHRFRIPFTVPRGEKKETIQGVALEVAKKMGSSKKAAELWLTKITELQQEFELVLWMEIKVLGNSSASLTAQCLWNLEEAFAQKGIQLLQANRYVTNGVPIQEI